MFDELDYFLSSEKIMNLDISSVGLNSTEFGEYCNVRSGLWLGPSPTLSKYTISHFGSKGQLLFISIVHPTSEYEFLRIALYPKNTVISIKTLYNGEQEARYTLKYPISEKDYYSDIGYERHNIDYKLYCKMRHFRNFYDAYYFGEK